VRRRKLLVALAVGLTVVVAAGLWPRIPRAETITPGNFDRLRRGMSRAQVEAILGPPGDYRTGPAGPRISIPTRFIGVGLRRTDLLPPVYWTSDTVQIKVVFDSNGTTAELDNTLMRPQHLGPLDNLWWHAERQWRRWFPAE
jgi:hypothetical protein